MVQKGKCIKVLYISRFKMERYRSVECVPSTKGVHHPTRRGEWLHPEESLPFLPAPSTSLSPGKHQAAPRLEQGLEVRHSSLHGVVAMVLGNILHIYMHVYIHIIRLRYL